MATTTEPLVNAKEDSKEGTSAKTLFPPAIPSHTLWRVDQFAPLRVSLMNYDWLAEYLEKHPTALRHHLIKSSKEGDKDENFAVLTAETSELQKFVLGHLKTKEAWGEYTELKKQVGKE